ncbi:hypothetical protein [Streptomyces sp. NPDC050564]|uniref:hypothetical protein n=1 Tax=Streptomyces sp. NPDC050564 TaxID=3365631 RepID=UPI0037AA97BE
MNIAQHTWPLYHPGSDEPVLPELLEEARKAREEGGCRHPPPLRGLLAHPLRTSGRADPGHPPAHGGQGAWIGELVEWTTTFDAALLVVPNAAEMRERVFEVVRQLAFYEALGQTHSEANGWIDVTCIEALEILSAFLREEPLPPRSKPFRDRAEMIAAHIRGPSGPSETCLRFEASVRIIAISRTTASSCRPRLL